MTLDETRAVVREHNENLGVTGFIEAERGDFVIFNYVIQFDGMFGKFTGDPVNDRKVSILRECRGITFSKETGKVIIRKLQKFWNLGQNEESQAHLIDWTQPHVILMKEDGSMITPYRGRDGVIDWHTKMGATDVAQLAVAYVAETSLDYDALVAFCEERGLTPMFEFCSRKQKIVIDYPEDKLVLLALRNIEDGTYVEYHEMARIAGDFGIPVVDMIEGSVTDANAFLEQVRVLEGVEGYIVRFASGHMVKVKAEEYLRLHNMFDMLQREKDVLGLILSDVLDDAKAIMDDDSRRWVDTFEEAVQRGCAATGVRLKAYTDDAVAQSGGDQKVLATKFVNIDTVPPRERGLIFQIARGRDATAVVLDYVGKNVSTSTKVGEVRDLFGGHRWENFRDTIVPDDD